METSKNLLRALDMVTTPKEPRPERLGAVSVAHAQQMRTIFDDPNVIGVGISEKVTGKRRTGELSLCFYRRSFHRAIAPSAVAKVIYACVGFGRRALLLRDSEPTVSTTVLLCS
jgi:hypothetical protein